MSELDILKKRLEIVEKLLAQYRKEQRRIKRRIKKEEKKNEN